MIYNTKRYQDGNGNVPYSGWIQKLRRKDPRAAVKIDIRVDRAGSGNFGDHRFERDGVWELKINYGPGYRVYYAMDSNEIILLLIGGDKSSQKKDLEKAVQFYRDYQQR